MSAKSTRSARQHLAPGSFEHQRQGSSAGSSPLHIRCACRTSLSTSSALRSVCSSTLRSALLSAPSACSTKSRQLLESRRRQSMSAVEAASKPPRNRLCRRSARTISTARSGKSAGRHRMSMSAPAAEERVEAEPPGRGEHDRLWPWDRRTLRASSKEAAGGRNSRTCTARGREREGGDGLPKRGQSEERTTLDPSVRARMNTNVRRLTPPPPLPHEQALNGARWSTAIRSCGRRCANAGGT